MRVERIGGGQVEAGIGRQRAGFAVPREAVADEGRGQRRLEPRPPGPGQRRRGAVHRPAGEQQAGGGVAGIEIGVGGVEAQARGDENQRAAKLDALHGGAADVLIGAGRGIEVQQVAEPAQEGGRRQGQPAIEQRLIDADVAADALLRFQRVGDAGIEIERPLEEGRALGAGAEAGAQLGVAVGDLVGGGEAAGEEAVGARLAVVAPAEGQEQVVDGRDLVAGKEGIARGGIVEAGGGIGRRRRVFGLLLLQPDAAEELAEGSCPDRRTVLGADRVRAEIVARRGARLVVVAVLAGGEAGERLLDGAVRAGEVERAIAGDQRPVDGVAGIGGGGGRTGRRRRIVVIRFAGGAGDAKLEAGAVGGRVAAGDRPVPAVEAVRLVVVAVADPGEARGGDMLAAEQHAEIALGEAARQALGMGAVAAPLDRPRGTRRPMRLAGDDVDDPAHGVGAVDRALRPAQDLDPLDVVERDRGEIELVAGGRGVVDAHAVDQHQRVPGLAAAQVHFRRAAGAAQFDHRDAGHRAQQIGNRGRRGLLDLVAGDDGNGAARLGRRDRHVIRRDDDRRHLGQGRGGGQTKQEGRDAGAPGRRSHDGRSPLWIDLAGAPVTSCVPSPIRLPRRTAKG